MYSRIATAGDRCRKVGQMITSYLQPFPAGQLEAAASLGVLIKKARGTMEGYGP